MSIPTLMCRFAEMWLPQPVPNKLASRLQKNGYLIQEVPRKIGDLAKGAVEAVMGRCADQAALPQDKTKTSRRMNREMPVSWSDVPPADFERVEVGWQEQRRE